MASFQRGDGRLEGRVHIQPNSRFSALHVVEGSTTVSTGTAIPLLARTAVVPNLGLTERLPQAKAWVWIRS